jgi:hypothetical protein
MTQATIAQPALLDWRLRDSFAAAALLLLTAATVLWQNAHVAVLWDLSYVLDTATRISQGQMPYRDFPLAHAPLTFLIQAAILRLTGRVFFHHALYAAVTGGLGSVLAWRIILRSLRDRVASIWWFSLLIAAPLAVLGIYCIFPHPSYDNDCALAVLFALFLLQRLTRSNKRAGIPAGLAAGAALCLPLFFKQNIGLPFLLTVLALVVLLLVLVRLRPAVAVMPEPCALFAVLAGAAATLAAAALVLHFTAGIANYLHWTIGFAAQRRMPGLAAMAGVYADPFLYWSLPSVVAALALLRGPLARKPWTQTLWARIAAFALLAAPFVYTLAALLIYDDADERGDSLLALWPLVLVLAAVLALARLVALFRKGRTELSLAPLLPLAALAAIHGALMSQQLWGSTYALWPLFLYLLAELLPSIAPSGSEPLSVPLPRWFIPALASVAVLAVVVCGGFYTASEERLSYADLPGGPAATSTLPELAGLSLPGPYLANFEELVQFTQAYVPPGDSLLLLPGEDPFYFATGRTPRFPVLLFDPATDPYAPQQLLDEAHRRQVRWLIVKRALQIKEDPTPNREATLKLLTREYFLAVRLRGYDIYHYSGMHPAGHPEMKMAMHP